MPLASKRKGAVLTRGELVTVEITHFAPTGEGIGHVEHKGERRAVFVPRSAPGDRWRGFLDDSQRPARLGPHAELVSKRIERAPLLCPHASECGGCPWMHLPLDTQRAAHEELTKSILRRGISLPPEGIVHHAASRPWGYRVRARLAMEARGKVLVGYRAPDGRSVIPISRCLVLDDVLAPVVPKLSEWLVGSRGSGEAKLAHGGSGTVLVLSWDGTLSAGALRALDEATRSGLLSGAQVQLKGASHPMRFGATHIEFPAVDGLPLRLAPGGFSQANEELTQELVRHVTSVTPTAGKVVTELYAGAGTFSVALAREARIFVSIEAAADAVTMARENLRARGLTKAKLLTGDASQFPRSPRPQVIVMDPPRTGLSAETLTAVLQAHPGWITYVSCDLVTLARDATRLTQAGYAARSLHTFEMMPQTSHLEAVLTLERIQLSRESRELLQVSGGHEADSVST